MRQLAALLLFLVALALPAGAEERILDFHSDIEVHADASMTVTETIRVRAEGQEIKRGIYRDFPTDYTDRFGNRYRVGFEVVSVQRNGQAEPWHIRPEGNGVRVYMGEKDTWIGAGEHTYALTYRTTRQLGFFDDHDELYWNVTGNDWAFPIDRAGARVVLPEQVPPERFAPEAYTGPRGARGTDYRTQVEADGSVRFETTRPFARGEGLTLVVAWPKGYVFPPTPREKVGYLLHDNRSWVVLASGFTLLLLYYMTAWVLVGRDPEPGVIITRYAPPPGVTPAAARFLRRMGYDHKAFAAALVNLAVNGLVTIRDDDGFVLTRTQADAGDLAPGESAILKELFHDTKGATLPLEQGRHQVIRKAIKAHQAALKRNSEKIHFLNNRNWLLPGLVGTVAIFAAIIFALPSPDQIAIGGFLSLWLTFWTFGVFTLATKVWHAWRAVDGPLKFIGALAITAFATPFFAAEVFVAGMLGSQASPALPACLIAGVAVNALFHHLLKAPTRAGRNLLDQLEGFRQFLDVAERDEMNFRNPPEKTPELFEKLLPYALALGVEQHWMERFAGLFARLEERGETYRPVWYHGPHWRTGNLAGFSNSLGSSLGAALAASSTAPGSSSGSGGGGSSGGGGGGGGGGGW